MPDVSNVVLAGELERREGISRLGDEREVFDRAVEVIGDRQQAMRWLGTPVRALGYATPISLMHDTNGLAAVLRVLGRLEHGVL